MVSGVLDTHKKRLDDVLLMSTQSMSRIKKDYILTEKVSFEAMVILRNASFQHFSRVITSQN